MYHYQEYNPDARLTAWVKNYWLATNFVHSEVLPKVFPDGCMDIIFDFDKTKGISHVEIFGTTTSFIEFDSAKHAQMFGIRFKPAGITAFTRIPPIEFTDRSVELSLVKTLFDKSFYETLPEKKSATELIAHTNNYLINLLPHLYHSERQITCAVNTINLAKGQLNLAALASAVCLSQRHFERKFKAAIGVSPKMYAKIVKFKHAMHNIVAYPNKDLLTIAIECGYYDRTHLMKDIKSLSGDVPTDVRQKKSIFYAYGDEYAL